MLTQEQAFQKVAYNIWPLYEKYKVQIMGDDMFEVNGKHLHSFEDVDAELKRLELESFRNSQSLLTQAIGWVVRK